MEYESINQIWDAIIMCSLYSQQPITNQKLDTFLKHPSLGKDSAKVRVCFMNATSMLTQNAHHSW